jgi:hypothetical protein
MAVSVITWGQPRGFCGGYGGFDTPRDASVSNGFKLSGLSGLTFPIGNTYDGANKTNEH